MLLPTLLRNNIESLVGLYQLAISFASDAEGEAKSVYEFCHAYGVSCYWYHSNAVWQSGIDIFDCMSFAYAHSANIAILNSPRYCKSEATQFEFNVIRSRCHFGRIDVFSLGGADIELEGANIHRHPFDAEHLIDVISEIRGNNR